MAFALDTSRVLRSYAQLDALVRAVIAADPSDEDHFIEWKGWLDLSSRKGQFAVSRAIIGMSNRTVALASTRFEGCSYVIVGAEAGAAGGVAPIDQAPLNQGLSRYLGQASPTFQAQSVDIDGRSVMVFTIEAPRDGDPIFSTATEFGDEVQTVRSGSIFVRKGARTEYANHGDLAALQHRLLSRSSTPSLSGIEAQWSSELLMPRLDLGGPAVQAAVDAEWTALGDPPKVARADRLSVIAGWDYVSAADARAYERQVQAYLELFRKDVPARAQAAAFELGSKSGVRLVATNGTEEVLTDVQVRIELPETLWILHEEPECEFPSRPKRPDASPFADMHASTFASLRNTRVPNLDAARHGTSLTMSFGDLHPGASSASTELVILGKPSAPAVVKVAVTTTAGNRRGRQASSLDVHLGDTTLQAAELIAAAE